MNAILRASLGVASLVLSLFVARAAHADPLRPAPPSPLSPPQAAPARFISTHAWAFAAPLRALALRPEQQAEAQRIEASVNVAATAVKASMVEFLQALSAQVNANAIDLAALRPKINAASHAMEAEWRAARGADQKLHALLDKPQRVALVDTLEQAFTFGTNARAHAPSPLPALPAGVTLTRDQQRLAATLAPPAQPPAFQAVLAEMRRDLDAFKEDRYLRSSIADRVPRPWESLAAFVESTRKIVSVLTPEQRALVARSFAENAKGGAMVL